MDGLVMCGGRGTRLDATVEKPLFEIAGTPMIEHVYDAFAGSDLGTVYTAPSPQTPDTREFLNSRAIPCLGTPGEGYVADLDAALSELDGPVLTAAADLPLLSPDPVDRILARHDRGSLAVAVPAALKEALGVSYDHSFDHRGQEVVPAGINVVGDAEEETTVVSHDARFAVNVNRRSDARIAEILIPTREEKSSGSDGRDQP